ncbi:MAG: Lrp/AsnC family transcriptional regulator [Bacteroidota bacterium]
MKKIDDTDKKILEILQLDATTNIKEIASRLNMTKTPIYERIKRLEKEAIIQKYVAVVDRKKITSSIIVFLSGSLDVGKFEEIKEFYAAIENVPEIMECYLMGGDTDFMLKVICPSLDTYHDFFSRKIATLPRIGQIKSSFVINEVKHSTVLPFLE